MIIMKKALDLGIAIFIALLLTWVGVYNYMFYTQQSGKFITWTQFEDPQGGRALTKMLFNDNVGGSYPTTMKIGAYDTYDYTFEIVSQVPEYGEYGRTILCTEGKQASYYELANEWTQFEEDYYDNWDQNDYFLRVIVRYNPKDPSFIDRITDWTAFNWNYTLDQME